MAADEIWERVGIAVVGEVPGWPTGNDPTYVFESAGEPFGQEAFQQLHAFLQLMYGEMHPVIAITSCDPRDGKSTVAAIRRGRWRTRDIWLPRSTQTCGSRRSTRSSRAHCRRA